MRRVDEAIRQVLADALAGELSDPAGRIHHGDRCQDKPGPARRARVRQRARRRGRAQRLARRAAPARTAAAGRGSPASCRCGARRRSSSSTTDTTDRALRVESLLRETAVTAVRPASVVLEHARAGARARSATGERFAARHAREPRRRRARLADRDAGAAAGARQGLGDGDRAGGVPAAAASTASSRSTVSPPQPPEDLDRPHHDLPRLRQPRPQPARRAARGRAAAQHRSPPRQHALRHDQPRRRGRLVHGGDRLGPDPRPGRRRSDAGDRRGALRRAGHRHRSLLLREHRRRGRT